MEKSHFAKNTPKVQFKALLGDPNLARRLKREGDKKFLDKQMRNVSDGAPKQITCFLPVRNKNRGLLECPSC